MRFSPHLWQLNSRPITPISSDPEAGLFLTPAMLLSQNVSFDTLKDCQFELKDMYKAQWKHVQVLSNTFWKRWKEEYLSCLQMRSKWQQDRPNIKDGDLVLLKDMNLQNDWSLGLVVNAIKSEDNKVRKAEVRVNKDGSITTYTRPITELVVLLD